MAINNATVVLVHGAWADGSSWAKVIGPLASSKVKAIAAPLPLTSFRDDLAALDRTLERVEGPVVLAGHAYAGAVIGATRSDKVKGLVYVAALAPDEGETVADVFYRGHATSAGAQARAGRAWADLSARSGLRRRLRAKCVQRRTDGAGGGAAADLARLHHCQDGTPAMERPAIVVPRRRAGPHDRRGKPSLHGRADEGPDSLPSGRPHPSRDRARDRRRHHPRGDRRSRQRLRSLPHCRAKGKAS